MKLAAGKMSQATNSIHPNFSLTAARHIVKDCFKPNPLIYWTDFVVSYGLAIFCFQKVRGGNIFVPHQGFTGSFSQIFFFFASCFLFYRASLFIHEIVHQRGVALPVFRFVWNLTCGIPFLIPSFVYYTHIDHHRRSHYGTEHDGEYIDLIRRGPLYILFYLSWSFVIPALVVMRFLILTPIAWTVPGARAWIHRHASSMVMDPTYIRPLPTKKTLRIIYLQELGCFLWCIGIAAFAPLVLGRLPIPFLIHAYLMAVVIIMVNAVRTLVSHRWENTGGQMTFVEQLLDSLNYPYNPVTGELWAPVGLRYHALHHLFPSMPYHNMPKAHRRLMEQLPEDSPYRQTIGESLPSVLMSIWRRSQEAVIPDSAEYRLHKSAQRIKNDHRHVISAD
jgi:fatty acid desaturase